MPLLCAKKKKKNIIITDIPCAKFSKFCASSFMETLVSVSFSSFDSSLRILQPLRALSTDSAVWETNKGTNELVVSLAIYREFFTKTYHKIAREMSFTISQKNVAISLRFCRTAQIKSEAQGKRHRLLRYKQSPCSSLLTRWNNNNIICNWEMLI